jgi:fused signal recognition particle receptor
MLGWFKKKRERIPEPVISGAEETPQEEPAEESAEGTADGAGSADSLIEQGKVPAERSPLPEEDATEEKPEVSNSLFQRLRNGLSKTRDSLVKRMDTLFLGKKKIDPELLDELEEILITSDIGVKTTQDLLHDARERLKRNELSDPQMLKKVLKDKIYSYLEKMEKSSALHMPAEGPLVIMVVGVNGVGKTTTIGKIAHKFKQEDQSVLLVAGDTFRAAAIDQLKIWGERIDVEVIAQKPGVDPSSVVFDALDYAKPRNFDVVIIDTAGRLHTKVNLMEELKKTKRVMGKKMDGAPHEVLLVVDATTGQNAISQAKLFHEAVGVTCLALTKLDGTAKGGVVINISHELQIPIRFIGIGEKMEDLRDFDPAEFVEALFNSGSRAESTLLRREE